MTNEKLYTVTIIYTCVNTTYNVHRTSKHSLVFTGYHGFKKAVDFIKEYYIGRHDNEFYTVSYVRISETLIFR